MRNRFNPIALFTGAMLVLSSVSFAAPSTAQRGTELLEGVEADAHQILASATRLERISADPNSQWSQYDREWNEIQPAVESMQLKVDALNAIQGSLTATQKQAFDQCKTAVQSVAWITRKLGNQVDTIPVDVKTPQFKTESRTLAREARDAAHDAQIGA